MACAPSVKRIKMPLNAPVRPGGNPRAQCSLHKADAASVFQSGDETGHRINDLPVNIAAIRPFRIVADRIVFLFGKERSIWRDLHRKVIDKETGAVAPLPILRRG